MSATVQGIAHVQVSISPGGEADAIRFYSDLLGLTQIAKPASIADRGGCWFACGDQELHCGFDEAPRGGRAHPALVVAGLDDLRARLASAGVPLEDDRQIPGYRRFYARDPFGNRLEFLEPSPADA